MDIPSNMQIRYLRFVGSFIRFNSVYEVEKEDCEQKKRRKKDEEEEEREKEKKEGEIPPKH